MVFSSPIFLFLFLPTFLACYFLLFSPAKFSTSPNTKKASLAVSNTFILLSSVLFYFWGEAWLVFIMLSSTVIDYVCGLLIWQSRSERRRKTFLIVSIATNLCLLFFFKYFNFGLDSFNMAVNSIGLGSLQLQSTLEIALPLGISFYTFQSMSYTIDIFRREVEPTRNFFSFACFVTMFPQLVAGPIVRYKDVSAQLVSRTINHELFSTGCLRFIIGLSKKVLIANTVAVPADKIFSLPADQLSFGLAWLGIICYSLQIYFDFSGYSDMAIGLGRMLGFRFPENFNYPYMAKSIQEFWRRWHISLSSWFRDYLYIPLGGGRASSFRVYINLFIVFLLCGLWHGASWVFIAWGLFHGAFLVIERFGLAAWLGKRAAALQHIYVIIVVMGGWVLFRSESLTQALQYYTALSGFSASESLQYNVPMLLTPDVLIAIIWGGLFSWPLLPWSRELWAKTHMRAPGYLQPSLHIAYSGSKIVLILSLALFSAMSISSGAYNPFIYFRF